VIQSIHMKQPKQAREPETKRWFVTLPKSVIKSIKVLAVERGVPQGRVVLDAVEYYLGRKDA